jgi:CheY-like chemotaxis protein
MPDDPCKVLVVDDNRDCADTAAMLLTLYGHETHTAYTPEEAISQVKAHRPDVILMDIGLPGKNGIDVAKEIGEINSSCRIIALTGFTTEKLARECLANGITEVLIKPVEPEAMNSAVSAECDEAKCDTTN